VGEGGGGGVRGGGGGGGGWESTDLLHLDRLWCPPGLAAHPVATIGSAARTDVSQASTAHETD